MKEKGKRGSLTFFTTYRPIIRTAIYSCPFSLESPKDESLSCPLSPKPSKDESLSCPFSPKPSKDESLATSNSSEPQKDESLTNFDSSEPLKDKSLPTSNSSEPKKDESLPTFDSSEPLKDKSLPTSNSSEPQKDESLPTFDSSEPLKDKSLPTSYSSEPPKDESLSTSNLSKPLNDESESLLNFVSLESPKEESLLNSDSSYNYNGQSIPREALKKILQQQKVSNEFAQSNVDDVDKGLVSGLLFVSEQEDDGLEVLYFSISYGSESPKVFRFSDVYDTFGDVRMEDSGCFAGDYLIYVSTIEPASDRRQPWTAVHKTNLITGETTRLTPRGQADLNPAVSPCGTKIAVASFERKENGWDGEIEYQGTNIFVMNIEEDDKQPLNSYNRKLVVEGGGWPTWGSESVLFFHKSCEDDHWAVFRAVIGCDSPTSHICRPVTPDDIHAFTPAAIDDNHVAVVTIRNKTNINQDRHLEDQFRHIEIFTVGNDQESQKITKSINSMADHYNPFVIADSPDVKRIGYHRSISHPTAGSEYDHKLERIKSPDKDVDFYRVWGAFPSFSPDLTKLAFVNNEFKKLYAVDQHADYTVHEGGATNTVFAPVWNQNPDKDILYACMGPAFPTEDQYSVQISAFVEACNEDRVGECKPIKITNDTFNNAFPSTNPQGTKLVYRSTRQSGKRNCKNLYIINNLEELENGTAKEPSLTRLTEGNWVDTHCVWSPSGKWIAFSSNRHKPPNSPPDDHGLDTGHFAVYLVKPDDPTVLVRVVASRYDDFAGHVNHPVFSPDERTLAVVADLAAVSCDPISMPHYIHSVRPYGDIFFVDIDPQLIENNKDMNKLFKRATHSKYENSLAAWTKSPCTDCLAWTNYCDLIKKDLSVKIQALCQTKFVSGHICIPGRKC